MADAGASNPFVHFRGILEQWHLGVPGSGRPRHLAPRRAEVPRPRAQRGPEWFGHLGRPARDAPRGATEPTTSRQVAAAVVGLAGLDAGCAYTLTVVEHRVRASLMRRIGLVERVSLRVHRKEWRVAADETWRQSADWAWLAPAP
ncbi:MAG TPA: hypothetical protein VFY87_13950 [Geminicoccaceae bacterium]|jgi:hypothetical protein|nr:hypothetical protein [Geminicoccaceae bacterium]